MIEVNENYFNKIDSEEKAYWLGFIWADGYVSKKCPWDFIIQIKDIDHLLKFQKSIGYKGSIKITKNGGFKNSSHMGRLVISRKIICETLNNLGKNNETISIPNITDDLKRHFIRGFFDGDGSVYTYSKTGIPKGAKKRYSYNQIECSIIGKISILEDIQREINFIKTRYKNSKTDYMKYLVISNKKDVIKFYNWLYKDSTIYMSRKYNKFHSFYNIAP